MTKSFRRRPEVPEGDTIFRTARTLHRALAGERVTRFETVLPSLARIDEDAPLCGRAVESVDAYGKWLHMRFSGDLILLTHMRMSGSWHIYRPGERWQRGRYHMRIVVATERILAVAFDVPVAEFHTAKSLERRFREDPLGPSLLEAGMDEETAARNLESRPDLEIGVALMRQSLLAGIGNIFKSETCFACGVHPFRNVGSIEPAKLRELVAAARKLMRANVVEGDSMLRPMVYQRTGQPCRRCGTLVESRKHAADARVSFFCPECQR